MISEDEAKDRGLGGARGCVIAVVGMAVALAIIIGLSLVV